MIHLNAGNALLCVGGELSSILLLLVDLNCFLNKYIEIWNLKGLYFVL